MTFDNRSSMTTLASALSDLSADLERQQPPPLPRRFAATAGRPHPAPRLRGWPRFNRWVHAGAALCAVGLLASVVLLVLGDDPVGDAARQRAALAMRASPPLMATGFLPVAGGDRWRALSRDEPTAAWLVSTDMPRERLAALGLPFDPARADERVKAELLMHASGEVLAVRVVQP